LSAGPWPVVPSLDRTIQNRTWAALWLSGIAEQRLELNPQ
jgi:hypothetical protein